MYKPLVFTWREQFLRALTGFVSCVGINLLAKMLVVHKIIVIQNGPSTMLRELWRKSWGCWRYLQLADLAKFGGETTNLWSLTKKVVHVCSHSGKAVKETCPYDVYHEGDITPVTLGSVLACFFVKKRSCFSLSRRVLTILDDGVRPHGHW